MQHKTWFDTRVSFETVDVRKSTQAFLKGLLKKANSIEVGKGVCVVQSFEPKPLYSAFVEMGFEY
ncbi:MAG: hypothetical protein WCS04_04145 [Sphaerochaetaceae bacterium]